MKAVMIFMKDHNLVSSVFIIVCFSINDIERKNVE